MFKGLKHTVMCTGCHETTESCESYSEMEHKVEHERSQCCKAPFEYVGLQPVYQSILKVPILRAEGIPSRIDAVNASELNNEPVKQVTKPEVKIETPKSNVAPINIPITSIENNVVEITSMPSAQTVTASNEVSIDDIITTSDRGVTNKIMIPVMRELIEKKESAKLKVLKKHYPDVFERSIFYLHAHLKRELQQLLAQ
jgi:hypothetical protein